MAEEVRTQLPRTLENPPRTTGNAQQDLPILIDWFWRAYQVITQAVAYINKEVSPSILVVANLPDPNGTTLAQAQQTANDAFSIATTANNLANANKLRLDNQITDTFTVSELNVGAEITFGVAQLDINYRVIVQPVSFVGTPPDNAFTLKTKTYATDKFTAIMLEAPGAGNSITFEWQLIRNS